ncbi:MAG: hypothetical protein ACI91B_001632 [Planctomycetota bacterium]|jgi:hypothetical protein
MQLHSMIQWGAVALFSVLSVTAQAELGRKTGKAHWRKWLQGEPIEIGSSDAPTCTVWAFYSQLPHLLQADGDYMSQLQLRYAARGVRMIAVVKGDEQPGLKLWGPCSVVVDEDVRTERGWLRVNQEYRANVLVLAQDGTISFVGRPGAGLADAIEHVLDDQFDLVAESRADGMRVQLPARFDDAVGPATVALLQPMVAASPRDGLLSGLLYLTLATKSNDQAAARQWLAQATKQLADEARPLALFADLVLRGDAHSASVLAALREPLAKAAKAAKFDPVVQLAYLRALVMAGDSREAGRQAMRSRKLVMQTAEGCLDYAMLLARDENPQIHSDLAKHALDTAEKLGADQRLLAAGRYIVALRCAVNEKAARGVMTVYLKDQGQRTGINNDSWYLMTQLSTMGRYDWFAVGLVERMLEERDAMEYFEFDTAALAMFLVGRITDAVALQELALKKGGKGTAEYEERLARYKAFLSPAPR